ncbi:MAG TPA: peroxiredoxin [Planctomycetaceae bacterium]|nr:peroxiredoxin [Planctomycetaceae bacterium]
MTINVGDSVPAVKLKRLGAEGMEELDTGEFFKGRKVVLFSVPGAFTPTCSMEHLPGFVNNAADIKSKGVDEIACLSVNDPFVMKAWSEQQGADGKVSMLPDWDGNFTKAMGLDQDISGAGLGLRGKRFRMTIEDGVVKSLDIEDGKGVTVSGASACLATLG